jgi:hypothetical protein
MQAGVVETSSGKGSDRARFGTWKADKRGHFTKLAQTSLEALLQRVGSSELLTRADLLTIEDAALNQARARLLMEAEQRGLAKAL